MTKKQREKNKAFWRSMTPDEKEALANRVGSSVAYIRHICYGHADASASMAIKIETKGKTVLTRYDLRPDYFGKAPA